MEDNEATQEGQKKLEECSKEEKIILVVEEKQPMMEERDENEAKMMKVNNKEMKPEKGGGSQLANSPKKVPKQVHAKAKTTTIPQPFSLATEKRSFMSRERIRAAASVDPSAVTEKKMVKQRRGSMDLTHDLQPKISKSASFSHRGARPAQNAGESSNYLRRSATTATSSKPKVTYKEQIDKKVENGTVKTKGKLEMESKSLTATIKKQQTKEVENKKLEKSPTFKASPLPSFYRRKDPPSKPEIKKALATNPKSPLLGRHRNKTTTSPPNTENGKSEAKGKSNSNIVSTSSKEGITVNKLIKGARKAITMPRETLKLVISKA